MADARRRFAEVTGETLVQVAWFRAAAMGGLPPPGLAETRDGAIWLRTGPEQVWILNGTVSLAPETGAVTDLSASRTRFVIDGPDARDILAQGIPLDLDPSHFPVNRFAQTGLHHTPVLLWRRAEQRYELWALRTFATTVLDWLEDAAG